MKLVGFAGPARAGKTSAANILKTHLDFEQVSFADPIRDFVRTLTGYTEETKEDIVPWIGKSPRYMMQTLGTEWGRDMVSPNLWVDHCIRKCADKNRVVIHDVRFPNEAEAVKKAGGLLVYIWRPDRTPVAEHSSESQGIDSCCDTTILNAGDLESFNCEVYKCVVRWLNLKGVLSH